MTFCRYKILEHLLLYVIPVSSFLWFFGFLRTPVSFLVHIRQFLLMIFFFKDNCRETPSEIAGRSAHKLQTQTQVRGSLTWWCLSLSSAVSTHNVPCLHPGGGPRRQEQSHQNILFYKSSFRGRLSEGAHHDGRCSHWAGPAEGPGVPFICPGRSGDVWVQINIYFLRTASPVFSPWKKKCERIICRKTFRLRSKQENEALLSSEKAVPLPSQKIVSDFD